MRSSFDKQRASVVPGGVQGVVRSERALGHRGASVLIIAREVDEAADGALTLFLLARRDRHLSAVTWQSGSGNEKNGK